jgi:hypothetical protein
MTHISVKVFFEQFLRQIERLSRAFSHEFILNGSSRELFAISHKAPLGKRCQVVGDTPPMLILQP